MKTYSVAIMVLAILLCWTATGSAIEVTEAVICRDVQDREPVGASDSFPADVGKVWCWSKIRDGEGTVIRHTYYHRDTEMAVVELPIRSALFRTYSSKKVVPGWTGPWRVDITDEQGNLLRSLTFTIGEEEGTKGPESPSQPE